MELAGDVLGLATTVEVVAEFEFELHFQFIPALM